MNELRLQRRRSALDRIEDVSARIDAIAAPDATDVEERVTSVHAGYDETTAITNQAGTTSTAADTTPENHQRTITRTSWKAAKFTATGAGKLSKAATRRAIATIETRRSPRP